MKKFIISIDQGTTSSRVILFDTKAKLVFKSQFEFKQYFPKNGWVEHDPKEIWSTTINALKKVIKDKNVSQEDRFKAVLKLAALPKNGSKIRIRNRCEVTGRPRGNYRKFGMSRIAFRDLASSGQLPGITKASW